MCYARLRALTALGLMTVIWGYNWVIMKEALRDCPPLLFVALRMLLGAGTFVPILVILKRRFAPPPLRYVLPLGLLQSAAFMGLAMWALQYAGAGPTAVLVYTMPVWLMLLAWPLLGEPIRGVQWVTLALAGGGIVAIVAPWSGHVPLRGTVLALLSAFFWATSTIWQRRMSPRGLDLLNVTFWQMLLGGVALALFAAVVEPWRIHWTAALVGALLYNAIPGTTLALFLWAYAVDNLPSAVVGMGTLLAPLLGVLSAWWRLGERPSPTDGIGMAAILSGLAVLAWGQARTA